MFNGDIIAKWLGVFSLTDLGTPSYTYLILQHM